MKTGKKWIRMACLLLCTALFCCSCGATDPIVGSGGTQINMPYIGIVLKSTDNPYFALIKAGRNMRRIKSVRRLSLLRRIKKTMSKSRRN